MSLREMSLGGHRYSQYELAVLKRRGSKLGLAEDGSRSMSPRLARTHSHASALRSPHSGPLSPRSYGYAYGGGRTGALSPRCVSPRTLSPRGAMPYDLPKSAKGTAEREMMSSLMSMVAHSSDTASKEQFVFDMVETEKATAQAMGEEFAEVKDARRWTRIEVCEWLVREHLSEYVYQFYSNSVDGAIVILDLTPELLYRDLRVSHLHGPKMLRAIEQLRAQFQREEDARKKAAADGSDYVSVESLKKQVAELKKECSDLKKELFALKPKPDAIAADKEEEFPESDAEFETTD